MKDLFLSKIDDMIAKNSLMTSQFFNLAQQYEAEAYLKRMQHDVSYFFWGGYEDAERKMLFTAPYWMDIEDIDKSQYITPVCIKGSGYVILNHGSFLGTLTSLGLDRSVIGDIVVEEQRQAIVFFEHRIAKFILDSPSPLQKISNDTVTVSLYNLPCNFNAGKNYQGISDTLSSPRLDLTISSLINKSREKVKSEIISGNVQLNFKTILKPDARVSNGDIVSIRGFGRFKIDSIDEKTKKDKYKLYAVKYT